MKGSRTRTFVGAAALVISATAVITLFGQEGEKPAAAKGAPKTLKADVKATEGVDLWGALIYAVRDAQDLKEGYKEANADLSLRLGKVFPEFNKFQMLGQTSEDLFKAIHSWVAPFKEISIFFDSKGRTKDGGIKINLQLWRLDKAILKFDAVLEVGRPVIIEGPDWGRGRLIFMVELQECEDENGGH